MTAGGDRRREARAGLPPPVAALADPALHGCAPDEIALRETHASWIVLAGELAWKVKKPIRFPFLDQSTLDRRRAACEAELELNRPLAPDIYRAVRSLVPADAGVGARSAGGAGVPAGGGVGARSAGGAGVPAGGAGCGASFRLSGADDPAAVEYAVEMRRFDEDATLAGLVARGELRDHHLREVADRLARFHAAAPVAADAPATPATALAAALALLDRNGEELLALLDGEEERAAVVRQLRAARTFAARQAPLLAARATGGRVRELHGDLRAEHVLPGPPVRIVDRLEFNRAWREIDPADELAFLAMDLTALGRPDAARTLLADYRAAGGDLGPGDDRLVAFHAVYRAHVRAKVALLRARQEGPGAPLAARAALLPAAANLLGVAERYAWALRLPPVIVVCGPSASGKSRLAAELARRGGRVAISSDVVRKRLVGVAATSRAGEGAYTADLNARTYAELARGAAAACGSRETAAAPTWGGATAPAADAPASGGAAGAIVDATFRLRADRDAFAAALPAALAAEVVYVECAAPAAVLRERAAGRLTDPERISDATPELALAQHAAFEPLDEIPPARHHRVRSDRPVDEIVAVLAAALDTPP